MKFWLFLLIFIFYIFKIFSQEITAEDLKLLESYQLRQLRDFVGRGIGSVSKAGNEELSDDEFFNQQLGTKSENDEKNSQTINIPETNFPPNFGLSSMKSVQPGVFSITPQIMPPKSKSSSHHTRNRQQQRKKQKSQIVDENSNGNPTDEDFQALAKILQHFRKSQKSTTESTTKFSEFRESFPISTIPPEIYPTTTKSDSKLRKFGLPIIVEQQNSESAEFVIPSLREKWQGLAQPLNQNPRQIHQNSEKNELLVAVNIRPSRLSTTPSPSTQIPNFSRNKTGFILQESESQPLAAGDLIPMSQSDWEAKMREISKKLGNYLLSIKKKKENEGILPKGSYQVSGIQTGIRNEIVQNQQNSRNSRNKTLEKAFVTILREGFIHQITPNQLNLVASITVIRDHGKVILVDTGLATDINGRTDLIQKLSKLNIPPPKVDYVVTTHGHPDHSGNLNDFPDAVHFQGNFFHYRTQFNITDFNIEKSISLTPNVQIIRTRGHTLEDLSVIVENTDKYGTIAISGDIFMNEKDLDFPMMWKRFSTDQKLQEQSRKELICLANFVIPGHGKVFKITQSMKNGVNCQRRFLK